MMWIRAGRAALWCVLSGALTLGCHQNGRASGASEAKLRSVELGRDLSVREIKRDVFVIEHRFPWPANALLVKVSGDTFVLVDTPYTPGATQTVVEWLYGTFGGVQIIAVNTGYHVDNLGGNEYLLRKGIPVHGSSLTARLLDLKGEDTRNQVLTWLTSPDNKEYYTVHHSQEFVAPDRLFEIRADLVFRFGSETVEVHYPGPSHAEDNVVVYFRNRRILFGGCMTKSLEAGDLGFLGDAYLQKWPLAVERVLDKYEDAEIVVPGHGRHGDRELLEHTLLLLEKYGD